LQHTSAIHLFHEASNVFGCWLQHDFLACSLLDDLAVTQNGDPIPKPQRLVKVVSDEDDRLLDLSFCRPSNTVCISARI
jgi:hypothetical protein